MFFGDLGPVITCIPFNNAQNGATVQRLAKVGQIVLVRNPLASSSQWKFGRITACHSGNDDLTRVVTIKTGPSTNEQL